MSKAELWLGVKYSEMNKQQKKIYWNMCKKESRKRHPESIKESNRKYQEKQKQYIADLEAKLAESENKVRVEEFWQRVYQDRVYDELIQEYEENKKHQGGYNVHIVVDYFISKLTHQHENKGE